MKDLFLAIFVVLISAFWANAQSDVHKVDFKNFTYEIPNSSVKITIEDGQFLSKDQQSSLALDEVVFGDVDGDGKDEAIVSTTYRTSNGGYANAGVFSIKNDRPVMIANIKGGGLDETSGVELHVRVENGTMIVDRRCEISPVKMVNGIFALESDTSEIRNDQAMRTQYKWNGTALNEISTVTIRNLHPDWIVSFSKGRSSATFDVKIPADGSKTFVVSGKKGQTLTITTTAVEDYRRHYRLPPFYISIDEELHHSGFMTLKTGVTVTLNKTRDYVIELHNHFQKELRFSAKISLK